MIGPIVCPEKKWLINFFNSDPTKREKRKDEGNPEVSPELQIMKPKIAITVHNLLEKSMQIRMNWWKGTKTPNLFFNSKLKDAQQIKTYSVIYHWQKNLLHPTRTMQIKSLFPGTKKYMHILMIMNFFSSDLCTYLFPNNLKDSCKNQLFLWKKISVQKIIHSTKAIIG